MMIVMKPNATPEEIEHVVARISSVGARAHISRGDEVTLIGAIGDREHVARLELDGAPGVAQVVPILKPYKLSSAAVARRRALRLRDRRPPDRRRALRADRRAVHRRVALAAARDGARGPRRRRGDAPRRRLQAAHLAVRLPGARRRRGCACSPRPRRSTGMPIVTELMDVRDLEAVLEVADVVQIGARNMQNYTLLSEVGRCGVPGPAQARLLGDARGAADGGGVHPQGGQRARDALRARDPHVRDRLPLHARPDGGAGAQAALAPAGRRRPEPRGRAARPRRPALATPPPRRAPTGSSSRCTPTRRRRSATARRRCGPTSSAEYAATVERAAAIAGKAFTHA